MPRHRPVDYPQVPQSVQTDIGLAPPRQPWTTETRFSWQDGAAEAGNAERRLEGGRTAQESRESRVPPLPTLPEHLGGRDLDQGYPVHTQATQPVLPSQRRDQALAQAGAQQPVPIPAHQTQPSQFRPDIPRNFQQLQRQQQQEYNQQLQVPLEQQVHVAGPTPSYEASQQAYLQSQHQQARMQEQAQYPGPYDAPDAQLSSHALPFRQANPPVQPTTTEEHQSSEEKPEQQATQSHQTQGRPVHVGPDTNPLSPHSVVSVSSPTKTTNIQVFPPPGSEMQFPHSATFGPNQPTTRGGTWHHGLGSCAEPTTCLSSMLCPCMVYGRTQHRLSLKSAKKDPSNMLGYSAINGSCLAWSILCGVNILMTAIQHTRLRKTYEMEPQAGNVASDCLKSVCCCCCLLAQDEKEMRFREEHGREPDIDQAYKSPGDMAFAPQT